ncbi:proline racemase family protein [Nonomuraea sp. PA05]|uniref:proline racemase family protein n=1 Tax=Nonomuraea sp. PA05 TaxID=2604466 RepID=UPI001651D2F3|nr:proline racemase family protein [Nonomuraea sp. PA05]
MTSDFTLLATGASSGQPVACVQATAVDHDLTDAVRHDYFVRRGGDPASIVAVLSPPTSPGCDDRLVFVVSDGMIGGCGEATMFAAAVRSGGEGSRRTFETAAGPIEATDRGAGVVRLRLPEASAVPRTHLADAGDRKLRLRTVTVGGNTFAALPAAELGLRPVEPAAAELRRAGIDLLRRLDGPGLLLLTEPVLAGATSSAVVWGDDILNLGPCGTGTGARMILALHDGELAAGDELVHRSPYGHAFRARARGAGHDRVSVDIEGTVVWRPARQT